MWRVHLSAATTLGNWTSWTNITWATSPKLVPEVIHYEELSRKETKTVLTGVRVLLIDRAGGEMPNRSLTSTFMFFFGAAEHSASAPSPSSPSAIVRIIINSLRSTPVSNRRRRRGAARGSRARARRVRECSIELDRTCCISEFQLRDCAYICMILNVY
eukprot:COSAG02_NODE_206_length_29144_cov_12.855121_24_plen_159_part_00